MKVCSKCGIDKTEEGFHKDKRAKDGFSSQCKQCMRKYKQEKRDLVRLQKKLKDESKDYTKKICCKCGIEKPLGEFHKDKNKKVGVRSTCKQCTSMSLQKKRLPQKILKDALKERNMRICGTCGIEKPLGEFNKDKNRKGGHRNMCRQCRKISRLANSDKDKEYLLKNEEKIKKQKIKYYQENKEKINKRGNKYYQENKEKRKEYYIKTKDKRKEERKKNLAHTRSIVKSRYFTDIQFRLSQLLRARLRSAIKNNKKSGSAVRDLGCSLEEFKKYIEAQFKPGMSWSNHGLGDKGRGYEFWHLDHIIGLANFNLADREQFLKAVHFTNIQPLWAFENLSKNKREGAC
jgi:hypothetical protein